MAKFDILEKGLWVNYDPNGRYWNSRWNMLEEVRSGLTLPKTISITDSTLREGEETPFSVRIKKSVIVRIDLPNYE
jgi:hypothetical protein